MEMPSMYECFHGDYNEPTWLTNSMPLERPRFAQAPYGRPFVGYSPQDRPFVGYSPSQYVRRPLLRPQQGPMTGYARPGGLPIVSGPTVETIPGTLELRVPLCCEKCIGKVTNALYKVEGVEDVVCDQAEQKVTVTGNVDPEQVLRRARRVKKESIYWLMETEIDSATPTRSIVHDNVHKLVRGPYGGANPNVVYARGPPYYSSSSYVANPLRRSYSSLDQSPAYYNPLYNSTSPYFDNPYYDHGPYNDPYNLPPLHGSRSPYYPY